MNTPLTLLVTGIGAPGMKGTIHCLKNNPDQIPVKIIGIDMNTAAVGAHFVDAFYSVPSPNDETYLQTIIEICKKEQVSLILPQTTNEIEVVSLYKEKLASMGIPVMVSPYSALSIANNKAKLLQTFAKLNLPYPKYFLTNSKEQFERAVYTLGYPDHKIAVKPPLSNGMRGFRVLTRQGWNLDRFFTQKPDGAEISLEQIIAIFDCTEEWPELLVMEHLPGTEYSVDAFRGKHCSIAIPRRRDVIRSGISFTTTPVHHTEIEEISRVVADFLGLQYVFGFQFKDDSDGKPKILECNPRIQGTMVASLNTGINLIWYGVKEVLGQLVNEIPQPKFGIPFTRFWGGVIEVNGKYTVI